jgi:hypothetical protein
MLRLADTISPSRRYVAMCVKTDFDGFYFRTFTLPAKYDNGVERENTALCARSYYMQYLDFVSCVAEVFPAENMSDVKEKQAV